LSGCNALADRRGGFVLSIRMVALTKLPERARTATPEFREISDGHVREVLTRKSRSDIRTVARRLRHRHRNQGRAGILSVG
jgi:hypothetical protein